MNNAMDFLNLKISDLVVEMDLSSLSQKVRREVAEMFSGFLSHDGGVSPQSVEVRNVSPGRRNSGQDMEGLLLRCLGSPLYKFPFTSDPNKEASHHIKELRPYLRDPQFQAFLKEAEDPEKIMVYPLGNACVIHRADNNRSLLFLKGRGWSKTKASIVHRATYFVAATSLPLQNSLLLHGVGITRNNLGCLFLGASSAGKTTVAELSPEREVISDDGIIVKREGSRYFLSPSPFDQFTGPRRQLRDAPEQQKAKLAMGFFLQKDTVNYLEGLSPADSSSLILKKYIHFFRYVTPEMAKSTFRLVTDLCRKVPFYTLHFRKDPSFWEAVEQELFRNITSTREVDYGT